MLICNKVSVAALHQLRHLNMALPLAQQIKLEITTTAILWLLCKSTCVSWQPQLRTGELRWCEVLLPTCLCWWQLAHLDYGENARIPQWSYIHCLHNVTPSLYREHVCKILVYANLMHNVAMLQPTKDSWQWISDEAASADWSTCDTELFFT